MGSTFIILSNGLKVANFNSPHSFVFEDGNVLQQVADEFAVKTMLGSNDIEVSMGKYSVVEKVFVMTPECRKALREVCGSADIVIAPLPVVQLVKNSEGFENVFTCFLTDRVNKICSISKFCR